MDTREAPIGLDTGRDTRVIGLVSGGHFFSHFYGLCLPPLFPLLKADFGVSYAALGLLIACYSLIGGIGQGGVGFLVDRCGARYVLVAGLALNATAIAAMGFAPDFRTLLALAILAGLGNSVFHPADYAILSGSVSERRLGRAFSVHTFSGVLGWAAAPLTMVFLDARMGWRAALMVVGLAGLAALAVIAHQGAMLRSDTDRRAAALGKGHGGAEKRGLSLLLTRPILLMFGFFLATEVAMVGIFAFSVSALRQIHGTALDLANAALTAFLVAGAAGVLVGGVLADQSRRHEVLAAVLLGASASFFLAPAFLAMGPVVLLAVFAIAGFAMSAAWPARDMLVRAVTPSGESGKVFGFVSMGLSVGAGVAPVAFGWFLDIGQAPWVFLVATAFTVIALLSALAVGWVGRTPERPL